MRMIFELGLIVLSLCLFTGCMSASEHAADVQRGLEGDKLTVGTVQREIHHGMTGAQVAEVLGSPNIVTTDEQGREVWVYDRVATDTVYSSSEGGVSSLILGVATGSGVLGGAASGGTQYGSGAKSTSQRTLTIVIKFDDAGKVRDFAYHASRF